MPDSTEKYIYHFKPPTFQGNLIYPLNTLQNIYPDAYKSEISKYEGRETLLNATIPGFHILWNDMVHCSPIHPAKVAEGLLQAGGKPENQKPTQWFKIPLSRIADYRVIYYKYKHWFSDDAYKLDSRDFEEFSPEEYQELKNLPEGTLEHYKGRIKEGRMVFLFHLVPHVLVGGPIDIRGLELITV